MADISITVIGNVATSVQTTMTKAGRVATFRLASNVRRWDRNRGWYDAGTNFFTVTCWRQLAENVIASLDKGHPVMVSGRMQVRQWKSPDKEGTTVEVEAHAVGHDLTRGTSAFRRADAEPVEPGSDTSQIDALHRMIEGEDDSDLAEVGAPRRANGLPVAEEAATSRGAAASDATTGTGSGRVRTPERGGRPAPDGLDAAGAAGSASAPAAAGSTKSGGERAA